MYYFDVLSDFLLLEEDEEKEEKQQELKTEGSLS